MIFAQIPDNLFFFVIPVPNLMFGWFESREFDLCDIAAQWDLGMMSDKVSFLPVLDLIVHKDHLQAQVIEQRGRN